MNMKKIIFLCTIFLFSVQKGYPQSPNDPKQGYKLVWEDNFERDNIFSTNVWSKIPRGKSDWSNTMSDDDDLFEIKNGNLILSGKRNRKHSKDSSEYITAGVFTKDKMFFEKGFIEVRCRLEAVQGSWPAIWMLPKEGKWPTGGEIDILERLNFDSFAYQTVHSSYTQKEKENPKHFTTFPINPDQYNLYAVEILDDTLHFYINNQRTFSYPRLPDIPEQFPFGKPFYLLIDMQLGGKWVGQVKPFRKSVKMYIDYVRYYQK